MKIQVSVPVKDPRPDSTGIHYIDNSRGETLSEKIKAQLDLDADWYIFRHEDLSVPADFGPLVEQCMSRYIEAWATPPKTTINFDLV